jgi:hypothetical protein
LAVDLGAYQLVAVARDRAGNPTRCGVLTATCEDNGEDVASSLAPARVSDTNQPLVTLTGYARFASPGNNAQVSVTVKDQAPMLAQLEDPTASVTAWTAQVSLPSEGEYQIDVTASSGSGGQSANPDRVNIKYTTRLPRLAVDSPANNVVVNQVVPISGTVSTEANGLDALEISLDGGFSWSAYPVAADGSWRTDWTVPADRDYEGFPITIRARDLAGNTTTVVRRVFVDNLGPTAFSPIDLSPAQGSHVQVGSQLGASWLPPVDGSGQAAMLVATSTATDTIPSTVVSGSSWTGQFATAGTWYFHLMAQDAIGNQTNRLYGPFYVEGTTATAARAAASAGDWMQSIVVDGRIDLANGEWIPATEQLDVDPRWRQPQVLFTAWDSSHLYLGWQGALWGAHGSAWYYLDSGPGGTSQAVHTPGLALPMDADYAVEIADHVDGKLWRFDGGTWQPLPEGSIQFAHAAAGGTEVRVPLAAIGQPSGLGMLAFASSTRTGEVWSVFPTTNPLVTCQPNGPCPDWQDVYSWASLGQDVIPNQGQPQGHHASVVLSSPQGIQTGWGPGESLLFVARVQNLDHVPLTPAGLILDGSAGLAFDFLEQSHEVSPQDDRWYVNLGDLAPGENRVVTLTARLQPDLTGIDFVTVTGQVVLPLPASEPALATDAYSHRVDSKPPTVQIDLPGGALPPGMQMVRGTARDGDGAGVARVEVQVNGGPWTAAQGTVAWQASIDVPTGGSFELAARAIDVHGYVSQLVTTQLLVDAEPPSVSLDLPSPLLGGKVAHLSGLAADPGGSGVDQVQIRIDDGPWFPVTLPFEAADDASVIWRYNWTVPAGDGVEHTISVRATDLVGNRGAPTQPAPVTVDSVPPVSVIVEPQPGAVVVPPDLLVWGMAYDGHGIGRVEVSVDGARTWQPAELISQATIAQEELRAAMPGDAVLWQLRVPVSGLLIIHYRAIDLAGNQETLKTPVRVQAQSVARQLWMPLIVHE